MDFFEEWNERLFGDIGAKFKKIALVVFWVEMVAGAVAAVIFFFAALTSRYDNGMYFSMMLACLIGVPISAWLSSVGLYAVGEHLELLQNIRSDTYALRKQACGESHPEQQSYVPRSQPTYTAPAVKPTKTAADGGWRCKKCGENNASGAAFCKSCGAYK